MKTRVIYTHVSNKSHLDRLFENRGDWEVHPEGCICTILRI